MPIHPRRSTAASIVRLLMAASPLATLAAQQTQTTGGERRDAEVLRRRALWRSSIAPASSDSGALVRRVEAGSPAERAGLRVGDRIAALNGAALTGPDAFSSAFRALRGGDSVRARVRRPKANDGSDTIELRFVLDSLPHETIPGTTTTYGALRTSRGYLVRTVVTRPVGARREARLPAVLVVPWLSCDPVEKPDPGSDGMAHLFRDVAARSGVLLMRVEKPGVGDSEGPD